MKKIKITKELLMKVVIITVFACTYIIPTGIIETKYSVSKIIFVAVIAIVYMIQIIKIKEVRKTEIAFLVFIAFFCIISGNLNYLVFITIPFIARNLKYKNEAKEYILESNILYICLFFTVIYSIIFAGTGGRYAFTAIKEINQSGLSIFCLGIMLIKKNKKIGIATLLLGMLTFSRSYYLACIIYIISNIKIIQKIFLRDKLIKICNYTNLTIVTTIAFIAMGIFYIQQYKAGNIFWGDEVSTRLYTFLDYSNFFRFVTNVLLVLAFKEQPYSIFTGMTDNEFRMLGQQISNQMNLPHHYLLPHNLFLSHLEMYGVFSIIEIVYISNILKKITNKKNFFLYMAIVAYSVILGAGLYSYWLYLTIFMLVINDETEMVQNEQTNKEINYAKI